MITDEEIKAVMAKSLRVPLGKLTDETSLFDLDVDSIDVFEMICEFEDKYRVKIPNERASDFVVVGDAIKALRQVLA